MPYLQRQARPEIYDWFEQHAPNCLRADSERRYGRRLAAVGADPAGINVREEILADFTGDALADPQFLQSLAESNPSKFRLFVNTVIDWFKSIAAKLTNASSRLPRSIAGLKVSR